MTCFCGCGRAPAKRGSEYVRGHRPLTPLADRLWSRVDKSDGCWEWTGYIRPEGYGQIGDGRRAIGTHRAAWIVTHGPVPDGFWVLHHCDNRRCVRPDHLYLGTHADNTRDAVVRNRLVPTRARGERSGNAKLTDLEVAEIRSRHLAGVHPARRTGGSTIELAREFGITKQYVGQIVAQKWRTQ